MAIPKSTYGQSQWQLIWKQFARNRLAVISAGVILLLILASIWAPFLAHDRPLYYFGTNRAEYREALQNCQGALVQLVNQRKEATGAVPDSALSALKIYPTKMSAALSPPHAETVKTWTTRLQATLAETDAAQAIAQFTQLRESLRTDLAEQKVELRSSHHFPVLGTLTYLDIFFLVGSVTTVLWLAGRWFRQHVLGNSRSQMIGLMFWLGVPICAAGLWWGGVPPRQDLTNYKSGLLAANVTEHDRRVTVVYQSVLWPPISYGYAESTVEKKYQPPPWFPGFLMPHSDPTAVAAKAPVTANSTTWDGPHWLGTDSLGRDALSRMIWGGRVSLSVGVVSVSIYVSLGILIGAVAGYFRGFVDILVSRVIEVVICFPTFFLILTIVALRGPSIFNIMVVIGLTGWTGVARLIRAEFLRLVDQEFVLAGRALGYTSLRLIFRHILPNAMAPVLVSATFGVAGAILTESALSFLGLGITIPIPSWGGIMSDGRKAEGAAQWLILIPGLAIFLTITCYNLVGEALRDASDPRLRGSR